MKLPSHFYAIVDPIAGHDPVELARTMLEAGARIMQLRLKDVTTRDFLAAARAISQLCHRRDAIFIVNDRIDITMLSDADGVHLGQNDLPLDAGRELLGPEKSSECQPRMWTSRSRRRLAAPITSALVRCIRAV